MGIIANLIGYVPREQAPQINSIYPEVAKTQVLCGKLPIIQADKIILRNGEVCHFVDIAVQVAKKTRRKTFHTGGSYRVFKGYTAHMGQSQSVPVTEEHYIKGIFYITNQRLIFVASENPFDKKLSDLTAVTPYTNGMEFQFGNKTFLMLMADGSIPNEVLQRVL